MEYNKKYSNKIPNSEPNTIKYIKNILGNENIDSIYSNKIENQLANLKENKDISKINYITIILTGKSGVGKSTLINALLKEYLAKEGMITITTKETNEYYNKKVQFLKLIDTRGIELDKENGPGNILKEIKRVISNPKVIFKEKDREFTYNDYIQCIWYCVNSRSLEKEEVEIIKELIKDHENIPLIIVYTYTKDLNDVNKMKNEIKNIFGDIPFLNILAKEIENEVGSFGLNTLINKTIDLCKKSCKGSIYNDIKKILYNEVVNYFLEENKKIKNDIINEIIIYFNKYDKVLLNNKDFIRIVFNLFEKIFIAYLKKEKNHRINLTGKSNQELIKSTLSNDINDFIENYKIIESEFVSPIKEIKAIDYLDKQAKIEKKYSNISVEYKKNKNDFINIIETYLRNNFLYITQKYFIYRIINDIIEGFSEKVEKEINDIIVTILNNEPKIFELYEEIYQQKIEDLNAIIQKFFNEEGYGGNNKND